MAETNTLNNVYKKHTLQLDFISYWGKDRLTTPLRENISSQSWLNSWHKFHYKPVTDHVLSLTCGAPINQLLNPTQTLTDSTLRRARNSQGAAEQA